MPNQDIQLQEIVATQVLAAYAIRADTIRLLSKLNEFVFRVEDQQGQTYSLRLQPPGPLTDKAVLTQIEWLKAILDETNIVVPQPMALSTGDAFGKVSVRQLGLDCRYVLFRWVDGERKPSPKHWVERHNLQLVGRTIAQLHNHSQRYGLPPNSDVPQLDSQTFLGDDAALRRNQLSPHLKGLTSATMHRYMDNVASVLQDEVEKESERGLIHADLGPHNWLFHQGIPRIIDFDAFARGYFIHDLLGVLWSHCHWENNATYLNWLFEGYETYRSISEGVKANVFTLQAAHCLMWINWVLSLDPKDGNNLIPHIPHQVQIIKQLLDCPPPC